MREACPPAHPQSPVNGVKQKLVHSLLSGTLLPKEPTMSVKCLKKMLHDSDLANQGMRRLPTSIKMY